MDVANALMTAAIRDPENDVPRLILADWLEEQSDPRAEFIRVQCALSSTEVSGEERIRLEEREQTLLENYRSAWLGPLEEFGENKKFQRGFLDTWYTLTGQFLQKAQQQALREQLPRLGTNRMMFRGTTKRVHKLAESEALRWTPALVWLECQLEDAGLESFVNSPHLENLSELSLEKLRCADSGLGKLAKSTCLPRLRKLELLHPVHGGDFTTKGVLKILSSNQFTVNELSISAAYHVKMKAFANAETSVLSRLRKLSLYYGGDHFSALAACPHFTELRKLRVESFGRAFDNDNLGVFLNNPAFKNLECVEFRQPERYSEIDPKLLKGLRNRFGDGFSLR